MFADGHAEYREMLAHGSGLTWAALFETVARADAELWARGEHGSEQRVRHSEPLIGDALKQLASTAIVQARGRTDLLSIAKLHLEALCTSVHAELPFVITSARDDRQAGSGFAWGVCNALFGRLQADLDAMFSVALGEGASGDISQSGHLSQPHNFINTAAALSRLTVKLLLACGRNEHGVRLETSRGRAQTENDRASAQRKAADAALEAISRSLRREAREPILNLWTRSVATQPLETLDHRRLFLDFSLDLGRSLAAGRVVCGDGALAPARGWAVFFAEGEWDRFVAVTTPRLNKEMGRFRVGQAPRPSESDWNAWCASIQDRRDTLSEQALWDMARDAHPANHISRSTIRKLMGPRIRGRKKQIAEGGPQK